MRYIIACAAVACTLFAPQTRAAGPFDGIWTIVYQGTLVGYMTAHENNGTIIAGVLESDYTWGALSGSRSGSNFSMSSIAGGVAAQVSGAFTSATTYQATQLSCVPVTPGYRCLLPNGATITGNKIW